MTEQIVVIGAGGFGREALDVVEALIDAGADYRIEGVVDASPREVDLERLAARGIRYCGTGEQWLSSPPRATRFIVAIGDTAVREKIAGRLSAAGLRPLTVIHPRAVIGSMSSIGAGVVVCAGVQVSTNVVLGDHVHLNPGCIIGHDSVLASFVSVNPGAIVSGNVKVEKGALLGANCTVLQGLIVEANATVGAGACLTRDAAANTTVVGVPARPHSRKRNYDGT